MKDDRKISTSDIAGAREPHDRDLQERERLAREERERDRTNPLGRMVNRLRGGEPRHDDSASQPAGREHVRHDDHVHHEDHVHHGDHTHQVQRGDQTRGSEAYGAPPPRDTATPRAVDDAPQPLFGEQELAGYRTRWSTIQTGFVDEPRRAVEDADSLVAELMQRLAESFASERRQLEGQWERQENVSTEDLRVAMRRYRSFFERLLSI